MLKTASFFIEVPLDSLELDCFWRSWASVILGQGYGGRFALDSSFQHQDSTITGYNLICGGLKGENDPTNHCASICKPLWSIVLIEIYWNCTFFGVTMLRQLQGECDCYNFPTFSVEFAQARETESSRKNFGWTTYCVYIYIYIYI